MTRRIERRPKILRRDSALHRRNPDRRARRRAHREDNANSRFVVCVNSYGYEASLERDKIYRLIPDSKAESEGDLRVVDESGEDYLYPAAWFVRIEVPAAVEQSLLRTTTSASV